MEERKLRWEQSDGLAQVRMGGAWDLHPTGLPLFKRDRNSPLARFDHLGFRLVLDREATWKKPD